MPHKTQTANYLRNDMNDWSCSWKKENPACKIFICNSCPRGDVCVQNFNDIIRRQCDTHDTKLIDTNAAYYDNTGQLRNYFYRPRDNIHLSSSGIKRLLGTINEHIQIVADFERCASRPAHQPKEIRPTRNPPPVSRPNHYGRNTGQQVDRPRENRHHYSNPRSSQGHTGDRCMKCGMTNHETIDCRHKHQIQCFNCKFMGHKDYLCWNV